MRYPCVVQMNSQKTQNGSENKDADEPSQTETPQCTHSSWLNCKDIAIYIFVCQYTPSLYRNLLQCGYMATKKRLLSGVKPTGRPHIGNYLGAMRQFVDYQENFESFVFVADYHALTSVRDGEKLREFILGVAMDYLAIGVDPKKTLMYKQSDIPEHAELCWIFNTITTMPYLMRAHAYKDAVAKEKEIDVGTFDYPMLMAADILLYDPDIVPVGQDQKQHVEYARDTAEKFNRTYGDAFKMPEPVILTDVAVVPGVDGRKMSKSYGNTIELFQSDDELKKRIMSIVTDSKTETEAKDPSTCNVFALHRHFASPEKLAELTVRYTEGQIGYKESKEILFENIRALVAPLRERRDEIAKDKQFVLDVLKEGGQRARAIAEKKMEMVRELVGVSL